MRSKPSLHFLLRALLPSVCNSAIKSKKRSKQAEGGKTKQAEMRAFVLPPCFCFFASRASVACLLRSHLCEGVFATLLRKPEAIKSLWLHI
jgi:hypothetical protein